MTAPLATTRIRWFLIFWLFLLSAVGYLDRVNISIAGNTIASAYSLSNIQLGYVFSAFLWGYALFQTVGGWLADHLGSRRVLTAGVLWWGLFTALAAAVPEQIGHPLLIFIGIRFLLGSGEAVIYPASNQFVSRWIPTGERGIANGWVFAGVGAGSVAAAPLITYVMLHGGWRRSFWICAIIGIVAGAVWYAISRDDPSQHPRVSAAELERIRAGLTTTAGSAHAPGSSAGESAARVLTPWKTILSSKEVWALAFSYFCYGYVAWIFFSWFFTYLSKVRGLDLKASAVYTMLPFLAMAVGCAIGGLISDSLAKSRGKRAGRCGVALVSMLFAGGFIACGSSVASARLASIVLAGGAGALYLAQSSFWSVSADIGGASSGSVSGFMNMGGQLGGALTAILTPVIAARHGWTASFLAAAALCVCGALSWMLVNPEASLAAAPESTKRD